MKRFLLRTLCLIGFAFVSYILLLILFGSLAPGYLNKNLNYRIGSYGHMHSRLQDADTTKNVDVLFLGSSHSYRGYDPRIFAQYGLKVFIMGSSAQTPIQTEVLVDKYLHQMNPKLVIFDIHPTLFGSDGVESSLDLIANGEIDKSIVDMAFSVNNIKVYNTLIYGIYRKSLNLDKNFKEMPNKNGDRYIKGGYVETYRKYESVGDFNENKHQISSSQWAAFNRIISKLMERNIPYLLIQTPVTKMRYKSNVNNYEMDSLFSQKGEYYNFNKILNLPDSCFFDPGHLNQFGVNVFNKKVINIIEKSTPYLSNSDTRFPYE